MGSEFETLEARARALAEVAAGRVAAERAARLADPLAAGRSVVSVGGFKRGKSSLINALVGADVLPPGLLPLTAVATEFAYGEPGVAVEHLDGSRLAFEPGSRPISSPRRAIPPTAPWRNSAYEPSRRGRLSDPPRSDRPQHRRGAARPLGPASGRGRRRRGGRPRVGVWHRAASRGRGQPAAEARQTAARIAEATGVPLAFAAGLLDRDYGRCAGQSLNDVGRRYGSLGAAPGVELADVFAARTVAAVRAIATRWAPGPVAVVAHVAVNRQVLACLCPELGVADAIGQRTGCWNRLERGASGWAAPIVDAVPDDRRRP